MTNKEKLIPLDEYELKDFILDFEINLSGSILCSDEYMNYVRKLSKDICSKFGTPVVDGNTSDGYHTFNELYDHRVLLWINYCLTNPDKLYLVENHFDGWFLLGKETPYGQISYHCPNKYLNLVKNVERRHPEFDGHSSNEVLVRLEHLAQFGTPVVDVTVEEHFCDDCRTYHLGKPCNRDYSDTDGKRVSAEECIGVCEECIKLFEPNELKNDGGWGHVCKMKKYKEEHRCESYIKKYSPIAPDINEKRRGK